MFWGVSKTSQNKNIEETRYFSSNYKNSPILMDFSPAPLTRQYVSHPLWGDSVPTATRTQIETNNEIHLQI